jgi:hypothetical protein
VSRRERGPHEDRLNHGGNLGREIAAVDHDDLEVYLRQLLVDVLDEVSEAVYARRAAEVAEDAEWAN